MIDGLSETVVTTVAELFSGLTSDSELETVTVVLNPPAAVEELTNVMVILVPGGTVPKGHVTVEVPLHPPCEAVTDLNVKGVGSVMVVCTKVAGNEPLFVIVMSVVKSTSRTTGSGLSLAVTSRSTLDEEFASVI